MKPKGYQIGTSNAVLRMASLNITGNVIPPDWFNYIRRQNGKPDTAAIMLLADIVYWYRPIEERDEKTGRVIGLRKKFAADKLQRDYKAFAEMYGYTKIQVRDALYCLRDMELIDLDFRHPTINGKKIGNLLYIGLNVDRLILITDTLSTLKPTGYEEITRHPLDFKVDTNTETTTEITTETTTELGASAQHPPASSNGSLSGKNGSEGKPARLRKSNADPRTNHPAIKAIFSILGRWPRMQEYDSLIAALGEIPDEERLRECWMEWRRAGPDKHPYSPMNFGWVVDWYVNGIPTKSSSRPSNNLEAEIRRREERLTHGN